MPSGPNTTGKFLSPGNQTELPSGDGGGIRDGTCHWEDLKTGNVPGQGHKNLGLKLFSRERKKDNERIGGLVRNTAQKQLSTV